MVNNLYKSTHNKYYKFLRFFFYIRYVFVIFFISFIFFLLIPYYFDYGKKAEVIKKSFNQFYKLKLVEYENINFNIFPLPHLQLNNVLINTNELNEKIIVENLQVHPKLLSIYDYDNFLINKIVLNNSDIILQSSGFNFFKKIFNNESKLFLKNSSIQIFEEKNLIIKLDKVKLSNYGYNKNIITGNVFEKRFNLSLKDDLKVIKFNLENSGINAEINFNNETRNDSLSGIFKSKILNTNLKFNFEFKDNKLNIFNSFFRNKNISFNNESSIIFKPYFDLSSKFIIEDFDFQMLKKLKIEDFIEAKNFLKMVNSKNNIELKPKKFNRNLIDDLSLQINSVYGRFSYFKNFSINESLFKCKGDVNLLEEFPLLFFDCSLVSNDIQKLLRKFSVKNKVENKSVEIKVSGNLSLLNNKINFDSILINQNYNSTKEDLTYFKKSFEEIFLDKSFLEIFNLEKIKKFLLEII